MKPRHVQNRSDLKELLERHGVSPDKKLGQHFLADPNITRKIAAMARVSADLQVVEIGPGTGTLTAALEETGAQVTAIEIDEALRPILEETTNASLIFVDAADLDLATTLGPGEWVLVSNLPYNVGTGIVLDALRFAPMVQRLVVMVQLEVAERLVAGPGSKTYGIPSIVVALHGTAKVGLRVPPQVFLPPPRVGSAVVVIERAPAHRLAEEAIGIATVAFRQRRKMLRKSLMGVFDDPVTVVERAGLDPTARPEDLDPTDFIRLAAASHKDVPDG